MVGTRKLASISLENVWARLVAPVVALMLFCTANLASATIYDFVEGSSGDVLAVLETDGTDPFDHTNVVDFSFTAAGDAIYGFGLGSYGGNFTDTAEPMTSDGNGGLTGAIFGVGGIFSFDPPASTLHNLNAFWFQAELSSGFDSLIGQKVGGGPVVRADGDWVSIPEPGSFVLLCCGAVGIGVGVTRRRRQWSRV